jgi:hypothetical protein
MAEDHKPSEEGGTPLAPFPPSPAQGARTVGSRQPCRPGRARQCHGPVRDGFHADGRSDRSHLADTRELAIHEAEEVVRYLDIFERLRARAVRGAELAELVRGIASGLADRTAGAHE